ncbi:MAG: hypothetical protein GY772_02815, partial [bacterium]|nr:hypothetical protein [bacterium]
AGAPRLVPGHQWEVPGFSSLPEEPSSCGDDEDARGGRAPTVAEGALTAERAPAVPEEAPATACTPAVPVEAAAALGVAQPAGADPEATPAVAGPPGVFVFFAAVAPRAEEATAGDAVPTPAVAGPPGVPAAALPPGAEEAAAGDAVATPAVAGPPGVFAAALPQGAEEAAAAPEGAPTVAAAAVEGVWTLDDIRWEAPRAQQPAALNNTALKWFRFRDEAPEGFPTLGGVSIDLDLPNMDIGVLLRVHGPDFSWKQRPTGAFETQPWSWRLFVMALPEDVQRQVIGDGLARLAAEVSSPLVYF